MYRQPCSEDFGISVILGAYNGAAFLKDQLDSLAAQTVLPRELIFCDDGSTDATLNIYKSFAKTSPFATVLVAAGRENHHFVGNFLRGIKIATGEYIAFCDQDDIWLPTKLELALAKLNDANADLFVHEAIVWHDGIVSTKRLPKLTPDIISRPEEVWKVVRGFAMVMRRSCANEAMKMWSWEKYFVLRRRHGSLIGHDVLLAAWVCATGRVALCAEPLAYYRVHDSNLTVGKQPRGLIQKLASFNCSAEYYRERSEKFSAEMSFIDELMPPGCHNLDKLYSHKQSQAELYKLRAQIYSVYKITGRLDIFRRLVRFNAHLRDAERIGFNSLLKDFAVSVFGSKLIARILSVVSSAQRA